MKLDAGDGHRLHFELAGDPGGAPAIVLHGGPGSGCAPFWPELFAPGYRIVLLDQRGCGRSTPHAGDDPVALVANTTHHLIADLERLRAHLGIERWLVVGGSWGSTLGLAYAERHPERVSGLVLFSVATTTRRAVAWLTEGVGRRFPEAWAAFDAGAPRRPGERLIDAYARLLLDPDPAVHERAARDWCAWEDTHVGGSPDRRYDDPRFRLCFARLVTHFWRHAAWLEEDELLRGLDRLADVPGVLIHGDADVGTPLDAARAIARRWARSELIVVAGAGHGAGPGIAREIVAATDRLRPAGRGPAGGSSGRVSPGSRGPGP